MILWAAVVLALAAALVSAVLLARRDRAHWPVVAVLLLGVAVDVTVGHKTAWGIARVLAGVSRPSEHAPVLWHLSQALVTAWPAGLAACALAVFVGRRWAPAALAPWVLGMAVLLASGPHTEGSVQRLQLGVEVVALVMGAVAIWRGYGRRWGSAHWAAFWLLGVELVVVALGPFRTSVYERWIVARILYVLGFSALAVMQVVARRSR